MRQPVGFGLGAVALAAALAAPLPGGSLWHRFFSSLRIEKPKSVAVTVPGFSGPNASRLLTDMIGGMIADSATAISAEPDAPAKDAAAASRATGLTVQLPARTDRPRFEVVGAHDISLRVNRQQLATILRQAGEGDTPLPAALDGAEVSVRTEQGVRAEFGHCPLPAPATIQGQLQGPPPAATDNGDCIILTQRPLTTVTAPAGLDVGQLVGIGLQLSGMSPNQAAAFSRTFDWHATLSVGLPRFLRSFDSVSVAGTPGVLFGMAFRRGPSYQLVWVKDRTVFSLVGYGNSADAVSIANSMHR